MQVTLENTTYNDQKISSGRIIKIEERKNLTPFCIALVIGCPYIFWRAVFTIDYTSDIRNTILGIILLLAEIYTFIMFSVFVFVTSRRCHYIPERSNSFFPSVDVFICTHNEDASILQDTITGCKNMDYPNKKIYILDDGKRNEVRLLANNSGCNYISRENNTGYKAGNINNALKYTDGELIAIFDADHIPVANFLNELVDFFKDEKVGIVQTPQNFFNPDPIQKNLGLQKLITNEQDLFFRVIESGLSAFNATVIAGTNFIIRRRALNEIGNLSEMTVTEDIDLGLKLEAKGYNALYYNKALSAGLAPENIKAYLTQRIRWAVGTIQVFLGKENKLLFKKLDFAQKILYSTGLIYYFFAFPRFIFLLFPLLFLSFNIKPVLTGFFPYLFLAQMIYGIFRIYYFISTSGKYRNILFSDVYETLIWFPLASSLLKLLLRPSQIFKQKFKVTDKGKKAKVKKFNYNPAMSNIVLLLLYLWGIEHNISNSNHLCAQEAFYINLLWSIYNIILLVLSILIAVEKPEKRKFIRVPTDINAKLELPDNEKIDIHILDLSKSGALISTEEKFNHIQNIFLLLNDQEIPLKIVNKYEKAGRSYMCTKFMFKYPELWERGIIQLMYQSSEAWV